MGLETLPAELVLAVLHSISSPQDLFSLICSSRLVYHTFNSQKSAILDVMLLKAFPDDTLAVALKTVEISRIIGAHKFGREPFDSLIISEQMSDDLRDFFESDLPGRVDWKAFTYASNLDMPVKAHVMKPLSRLWSVIDYFVREYARSILPNLSTRIDNEPDVPEQKSPISADCSLSQTEYSRLQRAFIKLELLYMIQLTVRQREFTNYFRPLSLCILNPDSILDFLDAGEAWQALELLTVHRWFGSFVLDYLDNLEDVFFDARDTLTRKMILNYFSNQPLAFHRHFLSMPRRDATFIALAYIPNEADENINDNCHGLKTIYEDATNCLSFRKGEKRYDRMLDNELTVNLETFTDILSEPNLAWHWIRGTQRTSIEISKTGSQQVELDVISLRPLPICTWSFYWRPWRGEINMLILWADLIAQRGYSFWDVKRLVQRGVLRSHSPDPTFVHSSSKAGQEKGLAEENEGRRKIFSEREIDVSELLKDRDFYQAIVGEDGQPSHLSTVTEEQFVSSARHQLGELGGLFDGEIPVENLLCRASMHDLKDAICDKVWHRDPSMHKRLLKDEEMWTDSSGKLEQKCRPSKSVRQKVVQEYCAVAQARSDELLDDFRCYW